MLPGAVVHGQEEAGWLLLTTSVSLAGLSNIQYRLRMCIVFSQHFFCLQQIEPGRQNLFHTLCVFVFYVEVHLKGYLGYVEANIQDRTYVN